MESYNVEYQKELGSHARANFQRYNSVIAGGEQARAKQIYD